MKKGILYSILFLAGGLASSFIFKDSFNREKSGFIEIKKVFTEFTYKKELEINLKKLEESRKILIDSMELQLKILSKEIQLNKKDIKKIENFQSKKEIFHLTREKFERDFSEAVKKYDEMIFKQINQYIKNFGVKNKYKYIYGAGGDGSLMYADSTNNLTDEVIRFINKEYKGTK